MGEVMNKTVRIVLYVLSLLTVAGLLAAFVLAGKQQGKPAGRDAAAGSEADGVPGAEDGGPGIADGAEDARPDAAAGAGAAETDSTETDSTEMVSTESTAKQEPDSAETESEAPAKDTTILIAGDVLFANAFQAGYDASGIRGVVSEELLARLNDADILLVNNEFPFSDRGEPVADKQFTFCCGTAYGKALTELGVDVVSLANNHTLDYGKEALSDTFAVLDAEGILYGGAGESIERAEQLQVIEANGKKFGFLAVSRVIPTADWKVEQSVPGIFSCYDETRLLELVEAGKQQCDFLVVYPHWGVEHAAYPEDYQKKIAAECIAAGADLVAGSHTHCLQGVEVIDGKPVFYSLGNFIFGRTIDRSVVVEITVSAEGEASYRLLPVSASDGVTDFAKDGGAEEILRYVNSISEAEIGADGSVKNY